VSQFITIPYIILNAFLGVINSIRRPKESRNCYWLRYYFNLYDILEEITVSFVSNAQAAIEEGGWRMCMKGHKELFNKHDSRDQMKECEMGRACVTIER